MKSLLILICLLLAIPSLGQVTIEGTVREAESKETVPNCHVILKRMGTETILAFASTDVNGKYSLKYHGTADSMHLSISTINLSCDPIVVTRKDQTVDIWAFSKVLHIREAIVQGAAIERRSDTLSYAVSSFIDQSDRAIEDVLKKLPGIEVASNGSISYNGKAINKFYVEGLDLLGGRYGLATKNISASDIASVQIYENHQPINALRNISFSDRAAVNLTLKESARGVFGTNFAAGIGYAPLMWSAEWILMMFSKTVQTLNVLKTNTTGDNIAQELSKFYDEPSYTPIYSPLNVSSNTTPPVSSDRYVDNKAYMATGNFISRLGKDGEAKVNLSFINDFQNSFGEAKTTYILPMDSLRFFDEKNVKTLNINQANAEAEYLLNGDELFLREVFKVNAAWYKTNSHLTNHDDTVYQRMEDQSASISNQIYVISNVGDFLFSASSVNRYEFQPSSLQVDPFMYPELFNQAIQTPSLQKFAAKKFYSTASASVGYKHNLRRGQLTHQYRVGYTYQWYEMNSELILDPHNSHISIDSFRNKVNPTRTDVFISPDLSLKIARFEINLNFPLSLRLLNLPLTESSSKTKRKDFFILPKMSFTWSATTMLKLTATITHQPDDYGWYTIYPNYIMNSYRFISKDNSSLNDSRYWMSSLSFSYGNAIKSLFASGGINYWRHKSEQMSSLDFTGDLATVISHLIPNRSSGIGVNAKVSKRIQAIKTTFTLDLYLRLSEGKLLRQAKVLDQNGLSSSLVLNINKRFKDFTLIYKAGYGFSRNHTPSEATQLPVIHQFWQTAEVNTYITKAITIGVSAEHSLNDAIQQGSRNMFFLDATCRYRAKRFEYSVSLKNLLNTRVYQMIIQNDLMDYRSIAPLRPCSIFVTVRMYI